MQPDGCEVLAKWRELGEWWSGEPYREFSRYIDSSGIRRESVHDLEAFELSLSQAKEDEDHREDWSLKIHKKREEKMALARLSYGVPNTSTVTHLQEKGKSNELPYCPLHVVSGYAFGRGTMLPEEIAVFANLIGAAAVALTDPFSLVGAIEHVRACRGVGVKPLVGASFEMPEGGEIVLIARSKTGYEQLSNLITTCHLGEPRLFPLCTWERLERYPRDLICLTGGDAGPINRFITQGKMEDAERLLRQLKAIYGPQLFVEIERSYLPWEITTNRKLEALANELGIPCVAGGKVTHARPQHAPVQDMLVCIDSLCTVDEVIGRKPRRHPDQPQIVPYPDRPLNAERYLRTGNEMATLFQDRLDLVANTLKVANRCDDDVLPSRTQLPSLYDEPNHALREITWMGANLFYPKVSPKLKRRIEMELDRIQRLNFSGHFLTMWDACRWAREQDILFSGRGSVVDSAVAYCLGFSRIDAFEHNLHFDRFLPEDGSKRPDIDIDFEAHRRNDVRNYLIRKYAEDRVATVSAVGAYLSRGIIREVSKAFGIPVELVTFLNKRLHAGVSADRLASALESRPELRGSNIPKERFTWVMALAERMMDIPRNIRAHSSGVVISSQPLAETVPVMWSGSDGEDCHLRIIQWDKRSAKHYFDKFDILCLRGQDVLSGTQRRLRANNSLHVSESRVGSPDLSVERIPLDDPDTYAAMRSGELIGIPQSASPAMRQAHTRLRTQNLTDASLVQAGIRPGVGGAVKLNEMIARKRGKPFTISHPDLEAILAHTYGIIVFQEQIDQLLQTFCGCSSGEAEDIREAIHKKRREEFGDQIREDLLERISKRGYPAHVAEEVVELVAGFKGYGFAQGHALAFAEISIRSIYCQQNFPAEYFASILDAQPAGYYGPCTLVNEARSRGVRILPPDVNASKREFAVEDVLSEQAPQIIVPRGGIRVGLNQVSGISDDLKQRIEDASLYPQETEEHDVVHESAGGVVTLIREAQGTGVQKRFRSFFDFVARLRPARDELERLILCGAFDTLHPNRRQLLWAIPYAIEYTSQVGQVGGLPLEYKEPDLPQHIDDFTQIEKAIYERTLLDLDVDRHWVAFERERIMKKGGITSAEARRLPDRKKAFVVGNPIRLRFPPTPSGKRVVFFDLEDETGLLNVTCFDAVYQRDGHAIVCSPFVTVIGQAQHRDEHVAFLASRVFPFKPGFDNLPEKPNEFCCR